MDRHVASLHRQQTDRFRQWRRALDEVQADSLLRRALAEQRRRRQIFTGQAPDDAPLTLQLLNAATNVLLNLPERSPLIERLHLERFNIVLDPTSGNYGVGATFRF